ncbi:MAG: sulfatase-like hydrolase/transferase [Oscillospiraceae bacterium]|nr:sulfatase-like hydrolase/transferase [Oscillospiraceae bacterium]
MEKPNVIIIMTDDQGYGDLGCMGSDYIKTPNIDSLAEGGVRFTSMYSASPVCSPSRAALLTGRYPGNAGVRAILAGHRRASGLTPAVPTIASALKELGYKTGISGKWHLGLKDECRPNQNGFDEFSGFLAGCLDYYSHIFYYGMADGGSNPTHDLWENENEVYANGEYLTELITKKGVRFINRHKDEPFFLYLAYNAPHYPMHAPEKYIERYKDLPWDRRIMAAMISAVDDGIGEIISELKKNGIFDNTIIYFQSDNGPSRESRNWLDGTEDPYYGGTSGIFTGHKFSLFEGGIRIPAIFYWGDKIKKSVCENAHISTDIFPTLIEACGGDPAKFELDGISILSELKGEEEQLHEYIFWEMEDQTAVRYGRYKLVINGRLVENEEKRADVFLSDLINDPGEKFDLSEKMPQLAEKLKSAALNWRAGIEKNWEEKFAANYKLA